MSVDELANRLGKRFSRDPETIANFCVDSSSAKGNQAIGVAFPENTNEVAKLLSYCNAENIEVVPSGGRTGLSGGATTLHAKQLVLSLERMNQISNLSVLSQSITVQAGVITQTLQDACQKVGLYWPVDFASKGSSQIGGNLATNVGGIRVIYEGSARQWVLGMVVVLMDGTILGLGGGLVKDNTGVDLKQLFIGTEGTLGVITEATLKLAPVTQPGELALVGVRDLSHALVLLRVVREKGLGELRAFEYFDQSCVSGSPLKSTFPGYVICELKPHPRFKESWLESLFESVDDGTLAQSETERARLWKWRENISESLGRRGWVHKNDIAVSVDKLATFSTALSQLFEDRYPQYEVCVFGHLGDGNLHVNVVAPKSEEESLFRAHCREVDESMFLLIKKFEGSVSAEHGVGLLKREGYKLSRPPTEIALMEKMKAVVDPKGLLNPGKSFHGLT